MTDKENLAEKEFQGIDQALCRAAQTEKIICTNSNILKINNNIWLLASI